LTGGINQGPPEKKTATARRDGGFPRFPPERVR